MDPLLRRALVQSARATLLNRLAQGPATKDQLTEILGGSRERTFYHLAVLRDLGVIQTGRSPSDDTQVYELVPVPSLSGLEEIDIPHVVQEVGSGLTLKRILSEGVAALRAKTLDARDGHLMCIAENVDERAFEEVNNILDDALERIDDALARNRRRLAASQTKPIRMTLSIANFESPGIA